MPNKENKLPILAYFAKASLGNKSSMSVTSLWFARTLTCEMTYSGTISSCGNDPKCFIVAWDMLCRGWVAKVMFCAAVQSPQLTQAEECLSYPKHFREWGSTLPTEVVSFRSWSFPERKLLLFLFNDPHSSLCASVKRLYRGMVERLMSECGGIANPSACVWKSHQARVLSVDNV